MIYSIYTVREVAKHSQGQELYLTLGKYIIYINTEA